MSVDHHLTSGLCLPAATGTGTGAEKTVSVSSPAAGTWVVRVVATHVPSGSTTFSYVDEYPRIGSLDALDNLRVLPEDDPGTDVLGFFNAFGRLPDGRVIRGTVRLVDSLGTVVATATVTAFGIFF